MTRIAFLASVSLALFACRGDDDGGGNTDAGSGSDSGSNAGEVTIQEVQNDAMAPGTQIELHGVVVVAIDTYGSRTGEIFVAEPEGGPFSGVKVYGASLSDVAMLQVGDLIDITGAEKHEACTEAAPCGTIIFRDGAGLTEVQGDTQGSLVITKRGTGTVPTPAVVDAKAIAAMPEAQRLAEWEKWEGVFITVQNARQLSALEAFDDGDDQKQFSATSDIKVQSSLTDLGTNAVLGTCYDSITGMGDFFFDYLVLPRSAADLAGGGTGCHAMVTTISALQSATTPAEFVNLTDVFVTAVSSNKKNLWVSTTADAAANEGVQVLRCAGNACNTTDDLPATIVVGRKVSILGAGEEFDGLNGGPTLTQISTPTLTVSTDAPVPVNAVASPPSFAMLQAAATGEPYEGVLVRLENIKLTALGTSSNSYTSTLTSGTDTIKADDDIYRFTNDALLDTCYSEMFGVWTFNPFVDEYQFHPRASAADAALPDGTVASSSTDCD